jgi:uncharacterized protein (TIGR03382 family)
MITPQTNIDDDNVNSIAFASQCPDFTVNLQGGNLPAHVYCEGSPAATGKAGSGGMSTCIPHTYPFSATFKPSFPGMQSCNVKIDYSPFGAGSGSGSSTYVMLSGSGMSTASSWTVSPLLLQFGDVNINATSATQPVTITNTGTGPLTVSGVNNNMAQFPVTGAPLIGHSLGAGSAEQYNVACKPNGSTGALSGSLTFMAPPLTPQTVTLMCRGTSSQVNANPNPAAFAYTLVGRAPIDKPIMIGNAGTATVTVSNFHIGTGASADLTIATNPGPVTLNPGGMTQVVLHNAASTPNTGLLGTLVFDVDGTPQSVAVSGDAQIGSIGTNPASVEFGPVCVGQSSMKPVAMFANAPGKVDVSSVTAPADPQLSVNTTSGTLQGNHGNDLTVTATLTGVTPAKVDDKLVINSNVPNQPTLEIPIHGVVLLPGVAASPDLVHFGTVMLDTTTTGKEIVISNCSPGPLMVTDAKIEGADAADFTIVSPATPAQMLGAGGSMTFLVVMTAHAAGMKSAKLVVTHAQGTTTADLDGTGYGGSDTGGDKDRETYYACSAGGNASSTWPVAILVLVLARRRRRK